MGKTRIKQVGIGEGAGEYVQVLGKKDIERLVEELEDRENYDNLLESAWLEHSYPNCDGIIAIDLESGEFFTYARYPNISNHAVDNNYIDVVIINKDFEYNLQDLLDGNIVEFLNEENYKKAEEKNLEFDEILDIVTKQEGVDEFYFLKDYLKEKGIQHEFYIELEDRYSDELEENSDKR